MPGPPEDVARAIWCGCGQLGNSLGDLDLFGLRILLLAYVAHWRDGCRIFCLREIVPRVEAEARALAATGRA